MSKNHIKIRKKIREMLLKEFNMAMGGTGWDSNNDVALFHGSPSGTQNFPYSDTDLPENLPNINKEKEFFDSYYYDDDNPSYIEMSKNNDVYKFPFREFKLGLELEIYNHKKHDGHVDVLEIAHDVISNLQDNPQYYSDKKP